MLFFKANKEEPKKEEETIIRRYSTNNQYSEFHMMKDGRSIVSSCESHTAKKSRNKTTSNLVGIPPYQPNAHNIMNKSLLSLQMTLVTT